jgi:hypothetical protein
MKYIKVRIVIGSSNGVFDIYYDSIDSNKRATLHSNGLPATGLTFSELSTTDGVIVSVPDESTSIVVSSDPDSFCSIDSNVNNDSYTIPIGCYTYTVTSNIGIFNYYYTDCECNEITRTIDGTNGQVEHTFCALYNTVNAGELEVTSISGCQSTTLELCYDENLPSLACECEIVPTPTPTPTEVAYCPVFSDFSPNLGNSIDMNIIYSNTWGTNSITYNGPVATSVTLRWYASGQSSYPASEVYPYDNAYQTNLTLTPGNSFTLTAGGINLAETDITVNAQLFTCSL